MAWFTPDSWTYFELSQTIFSAEFYQFSAQRSYASAVQAISVPFGYPVVLAVLHGLFGVDPMVAVSFNIVVALANLVLLHWICQRLRINAWMNALLLVCLLTFRPYIEQIIGGGALPLALLCLLAALLLLYSCHVFWAGLLLGAAALLRFDMLMPVVIIVLATALLRWLSLRAWLRLFAGLLLGLSPWMMYSLLHFSTLWASDSNWLLLASRSRHVLDYPAFNETGLFEAPQQWFSRVSDSAGKAGRELLEQMMRFAALPFVFMAVLVSLVETRRMTVPGPIHRLRVVAIASALLFLLPAVLTGSISAHYFIMPVLALLLAAASFVPERPSRHKLRPAIAIIALLGIVSSGVTSQSWRQDAPEADYFSRRAHVLAFMEQCQAQLPGQPAMAHRLLLAHYEHIDYEYGARSGHKMLIQPDNMPWFSRAQWQRFLAEYGPIALVVLEEHDTIDPLRFRYELVCVNLG